MLKNNLNVSVSLIAVKNVFAGIRNVISKYYNILYQSELSGEIDKHKIFSIDEIMFITDANNNQILVIGAVDNVTKDFRVDIAYKRNETILKEFITTYIERGNKLITNGWAGYSFIGDLPRIFKGIAYTWILRFWLWS